MPPPSDVLLYPASERYREPLPAAWNWVAGKRVREQAGGYHCGFLSSIDDSSGATLAFALL